MGSGFLFLLSCYLPALRVESVGGFGRIGTASLEGSGSASQGPLSMQIGRGLRGPSRRLALSSP